MNLRPAIETLTARDRLAFTLLVAAVLHAAVILGVGFAFPEASRPAQRTLEVTVARFESEQRPEDADFLAARDQQAAGRLDEPEERTVREPAPIPNPRVQPRPMPPPTEASPAPDPEPTPRLVAERARPERAARTADTAPAREATDADASRALLAHARSLAGATDARRASQTQLDARGERVRRISTASTRSAVEAAYLQSWRRKVERIGNLNYPAEARRRDLEGDLRVLVEIAAGGALRKVRILESSGHPVLDRAVERIVRLAAPFMPLPEALRAETDILQIVRTWQFRNRGGFASS